jgi:hypothetical protein
MAVDIDIAVAFIFDRHGWILFTVDRAAGYPACAVLFVFPAAIVGGYLIGEAHCGSAFIEMRAALWASLL